MKNIKLILFIIMCIPLSAFADYSVQGIQTICSNDSFEINAYNLANKEPETVILKEGKGKEIYFGTKSRTITCKVGKRMLKVEVRNIKPQAHGQCSAAPGSLVSIWIDGAVVMQGQLFNNDCYQSLSRLLFKHSEWAGFITSMCGHTAGAYVKMEGCFEFTNDAFLSLKFPLSPFPLEDFLAKETIQLVPKKAFGK